MADSGIHSVDVAYAQGGRSKTISRAVVRFGDGHMAEFRTDGGAASLRLFSNGLAVTLSAAGPGCCYERAVNVLRLYMPEVRDAP